MVYYLNNEEFKIIFTEILNKSNIIIGVRKDFLRNIFYYKMKDLKYNLSIFFSFFNIENLINFNFIYKKN